MTGSYDLKTNRPDSRATFNKLKTCLLVFHVVFDVVFIFDKIVVLVARAAFFDMLLHTAYDIEKGRGENSTTVEWSAHIALAPDSMLYAAAVHIGGK